MSPLTATNTESPRRPWEQQKPGRTNPLSSYMSTMWVCCVLKHPGVLLWFQVSSVQIRAFSFLLVFGVGHRSLGSPRLSQVTNNWLFQKLAAAFENAPTRAAIFEGTVQLLSVCATLIHIKLHAPITKEMFTSLWNVHYWKSCYAIWLLRSY